MSFRTRLLLIFALTVATAVTVVVWIASTATLNAFERLDGERAEALIQQFRREFTRRRDEIAARAERIAGAESLQRTAIELARPDADPAPHVNDAAALATLNGLPLLEIVANDGSIISSAQWPARFGFKEGWLGPGQDWKSQGAFLKREELPEEAVLVLVAVRTVTAGTAQLFIVAGERLDQAFLNSLSLPAGMRALLYRNLEPVFAPQGLMEASGPLRDAAAFRPLIEKVRRDKQEAVTVVQTAGDAGSAETFHAIPLTGRENDLLAVLLIGTSHRDRITLVSQIRWIGLAVGAAGIMLALALAAWAATRVSRPVQMLAAGAAEVARGNWDARVVEDSRDEIGALARAFNHMTQQLSEQRERLVQTERVAAWRELARRLAHELKNPLFPLQITVENLVRARQDYPEQFEEVFQESTATLLTELANLKTIVGRFSDFSRMPAPQFEWVDLNSLVRTVLALFEAQLAAASVKAIADLDENAPRLEADPEQLKRALQNLVLNALDVMSGGGTLRLRTRQYNDTVTLEISDTGQGLTREECERLFTPYYTTKQHGTGLGLAIVQSVVSDHGGSITVESEPGQGATFRIELPVRHPAQGAS